ncbi:ABC transporter permease [Cellulomonas sp. Sa3CUA2]|uniref:Transport permease protein n=1 Tax=Cellulomonas avistercoris TaxID=2762242 RepID=A0ABR8QIG4_9CELL|nr:ABC transporter permease [Cellulomonas avistercoris]MBD7920213.1 ABC transporter permease [Cellulomonas avistercoris]
MSGPKLVQEVREVVASRELLVNFVRRELRSKYKGTFLGWAWSLINPLATTLIYTAVFAVVMRVQPPVGVDGLTNYALFLLCGLLPWNFLAVAVQGGQTVLLDNGNLIKKTYFPRRLLLLSHIGAGFVTFLVEMGVLVVVFAFFGVNALPWIPLLLVIMVLFAAFGLGLALALSVANVYFRDVAHFVGLFMQIWFYATPIVYPLALVQGLGGGTGRWNGIPLADLATLNPAVAFIEPIRDMFYDGTFPEPRYLLAAVGWALLTLLVGNLVFRRLEPRLAEEL